MKTTEKVEEDKKQVSNILREKLLEQVENLPVFELRDIAMEKDEKWKRQEHLKAITEIEDDVITAIVSDKYKLVQFKEVFIPTIEQIGDISRGSVLHYKGKAEIVLVPEESKIGLSIRNSVDGNGAVWIRFCAITDNLTVYLPRGIKGVEGVKKIHVEGVKKTISDITTTLMRVRETWETIVEKFSAYVLGEEEVTQALKDIKAGKRISKKISAVTASKNISLWHLLIEVVKAISKRKYKNEIKKAEKIERICNLIYRYSVALNI